MDLLRGVRAFDGRQQKRRWLAIPIAVIKKFGDDEAGSLAALIAYYAFFSLFPLLLAFVTILGFILQGDPGAQESIRNSVLAQFPVIGAQLEAKHLEGHTLALVLGLAAAIWAGLGVTQAIQNAFDKVWAVPIKERPNFLRKKIRGFVFVTALGAMFIVSSVASGLVTGGLGGPAVKVVTIALSLLLNVALFATTFRLMTAATVPTRCLWIGVVFGAVFWEILQIGGGIYVGYVIRHASSTYGFFAFVIGLLAWLHLGAQATLFAAEINVVVVRRLWPRSLFEPRIPADVEALTALAKVEERTAAEQIDVRFEQPTPGPRA